MIGQRLGPYEITAQIGEGGMGRVFKARDSQLGREVALKVLPEGLSQDAERLARFEREAKLLASLNHPNIAQIYGLETSGGSPALVMELVEGPTLADRLAQGGLSIDESLSIARQIAEALEEAHEKGIVHRDLKPQNVKASIEGKVKVLDFGLAKAMEPVGGASGSGSPSGGAVNLTYSPTLTSPAIGATVQGVILGTAAYMSPEQAKGAAVDHRADIWAFGVVLWEMLAGRRLFSGDSVAETLAGVLKTEVAFGELPAEVPGAIRRLLRRCLERNPKNRLHSIADARIVLDEVLGGSKEPGVETAEVSKASALRGWPGWTLAFLLGALVAWPLIRSASSAPAPAGSGGAVPPRAQFRQLTFLAGGEGAPALAPDGESFAYVKDVDGTQADVFLQRVDGSKSIDLTSGCSSDDGEPAFSPDGQRIAYFSGCGGGGIFVMGAMGESPRKVTDHGHNPTWSPDGSEIAVADEALGLPFGRSSVSRIWAVNVETGARRLVTEHDAVEPAWSPDGRRIAFWGLKGDDPQRDVYTVAADGSQSAREAAVPVMDDPPVDWSPVWTADGRGLIFASTRGGTMNLWRIGVDPATGRATGEPAPVTAPSSWAGYLTISHDGRRLAFVDRNVRSEIFEASFDAGRGTLAGAARSVPVGTMETGETVAVTDDGRLAFDSSGYPQHLYLADAAGRIRQLTDGAHRDRQASFSPDGEWIYFQSDRWPGDLARIRADGSGLAKLGSENEGSRWYPIVSPDGKWLVATSQEQPFRVPLAEGQAAGPPEPLPRREDGRAFWAYSWSPDGQSIAGTVVSAAGNPTGAAILDLRKGTYRTVSEQPVQVVAYLPGGRGLVWATGTRLQVADFDGRVLRDLYAVPEGTDSRISWVSLSPDGKRIAWRQSTDESDIWLASFEEAP
jgi:Tol biopolymer transport system component